MKPLGLSETGDFEPFHNDNDKEYIVFEWLKKELGEKAWKHIYGDGHESRIVSRRRWLYYFQRDV